MLGHPSSACRRVQGLDTTAARSFVTLHNKLQHMGIQASATSCLPATADVGFLEQLSLP